MAAPPGGRPAALSLCGVQPLGAVELSLSQLMRLVPAGSGVSSSSSNSSGGGTSGATRTAQLVSPPSLLPYFTLPLDGSADTCLQAPAAATNASWQLQLVGSYPVLAVRLTVAAPLALAVTANSSSSSRSGSSSNSSAGASSGTIVVTLLDAAGAVAASWSLPASAASAATPLLLRLQATVHAAAVRVQGFGSLCEVQLLAAASQAYAGYRLSPLPLPAVTGSGNGSSSASGWQVLDGGSGDSIGSNASSALFDGNYSTCAAFTVGNSSDSSSGSGAQQLAGVEVILDRLYE